MGEGPWPRTGRPLAMIHVDHVIVARIAPKSGLRCLQNIYPVDIVVLAARDIFYARYLYDRS